MDIQKIKIEKYKALLTTDNIGSGEDSDDILNENIDVTDLIKDYNIFDTEEAKNAIEQFKVDNASEYSAEEVNQAIEDIKSGVYETGYGYGCDHDISMHILTIKIYLDFEGLGALINQHDTYYAKETRLPVFIDFDFDVYSFVQSVLENFDYWDSVREDLAPDDDDEDGNDT